MNIGTYEIRYGVRPLGSIHAAGYNPRAMAAQEMERLILSLETFGMVEPVVVRAEDGLLVGGHQRTTAWREVLRRRGMTPDAIDATEVPTAEVIGLSDERTKILNLALNRITGTWDHGKLASLLSELTAACTAPELELTGFQVPEIADYNAMLKGVHIPSSGASGAPKVFGGQGGGDSAGGAPREPAGGPPITDAMAAALAADMRLLVEFPTADEAERARAALALWGFDPDKPSSLPRAILAALDAAADRAPGVA